MRTTQITIGRKYHNRCVVDNMKEDSSKILQEFDFDFLKNHETIKNIALAFGKILKNYKKSLDSSYNDEKYNSPKECILINIEDLNSFDKYLDSLERHLTKIKHAITDKNDQHKRISIVNIQNFKNDAVKSFNIILNPLIIDSKNVLDIITQIEKLNPDLLYCFFNHETWGNTLFGKYGLHKEHTDIVKNNEKFSEFVIKRVLGFCIDINQNILDQPHSDWTEKLCEQDEEAYYNPHLQAPEWYYNGLNSDICNAISCQYTQTISRFRDATRKIQNTVKEIRKEETFNDEKFNIICKRIIVAFNQYKDQLLQIKLKQNLQMMLRLFYDYKRHVEEHTWELTSKFQNEDDFHKNLEEYLFRIRKGEPIHITHEGEKASGKVDFQINECMCIELKLEKKGYNNIDEIIKEHSNQIQQYMVDRDNKIGFLLCMDLSEQKQAHADRENYIIGFIQTGGRGVSKTKDISPLGIIVFWLFGGKHISPSDLKI